MKEKNKKITNLSLNTNNSPFFIYLGWIRNSNKKRILKHNTVQPCDTTQARSDSDFGINFSTIQFYTIAHNSKSNHWIQLKLYLKIPEVFVYVGVNVQVNQSSKGLAIEVKTSYTNSVIYFFLTCGLPIWQGSFFYKDMRACFGNFLVPQGSLMNCNIISKSSNDSLMFQNPFLIRIPYSS